jgi:hypothetical protein
MSESESILVKGLEYIASGFGGWRVMIGRSVQALTVVHCSALAADPGELKQFRSCCNCFRPLGAGWIFLQEKPTW